MQRTNVRGSVVFSYDTTALELFRWAKLRGAVCVLGQMDASRLEAELVCGEEKRWAGWALQTTKIPEAFFLRREAEWCIADRIIVNSRWSFDSLIKQGVPAEKLVIIPLCYEANDPMTSRASAADILGDDPDGTPRPDCLRVLFLGQVILGKGIQYLVEAAEELQSESVQIDVVGHIGISDRAVRSAPSNLTFHGRCSRQQARFWYDRSGIFVLPTISDGFAITQIEAMAHGLPVIATPHCGQVVTDGADGFIVPARDSAALASAIRRYLEFPNLRCQHAVAARQKAQQFKLDRLVGDLATLEIDLSAHAGFGRCEAGKCAEESEIGAVRVF
jgi:glycosyltransferase involved in cell wall biosynthesis